MMNGLLTRERFKPTWLGMLVNPFYLARKGLYTEVAAMARQVRGSVLDVGCGQKPYRDLFACEEYVGLELDSSGNRENKEADVFYDGSTFPFEGGVFDWVLTSQVLEHVFEPDGFVREMARVLKPEGRLFLTVPFLWDEHEQPFDYARYTSFGLRDLLQRNGFEVLEQTKTAPGARALFQLTNAYLYKTIRSRSSLLNRTVQLLIMAPVTVLGILFGALLPDGEDLYLDNVVLARKGGP